jgi:Fic family protein
MFDGNWELINGDDAHEIEVLNQASVVNLIEAILKFLSHHDKTPGEDCQICPDQEVLRELHRSGTLLLLRRPGQYRTAGVKVNRRDGTTFLPPPTAEVAGYMSQFEDNLRHIWKGANAVDVAAFALWRINWVHPFKNGNGRTARAFAYTCVCLKVGFMLPGTETLIDLITKDRDEYEKVLDAADQSYKDTGAADLGPMQEFVAKLLQKQLSSIP